MLLCQVLDDNKYPPENIRRPNFAVAADISSSTMLQGVLTAELASQRWLCNGSFENLPHAFHLVLAAKHSVGLSWMVEARMSATFSHHALAYHHNLLPAGT